jgi:SHS2 domain-containing protein
MGKYEFLDHTADVIVRAYGESLEEAFAEAARGMFDLITNGSRIETSETVHFTVDSIDREGLLVAFLSEFIILHDSEGWVFDRIKVSFEDNTKLTAEAAGEKFTTDKHEHGIHVKGVSYHMMEIEERRDNLPACVQVLLDI